MIKPKNHQEMTNTQSGLDDQSLFLSQPDLAREIAAEAHEGQTDKSGQPYMGHVERVASKFDPATEPLLYAAALLHDSIEDSEGRITKEVLLARGILPRVVELVDLLTRDPKRDKKDPDGYYRRISADEDATEIKLADMADNTDPNRLAALDVQTQRRLLGKYAHAADELGRSDFAETLRKRLERS